MKALSGPKTWIMRKPLVVSLLAVACALPGCHTNVKYVPLTKWQLSPRKVCGYRDSDFDISRMMSLQAPSLTAHQRVSRSYDCEREMLGDLGDDYYIIGAIGAASTRGQLAAKAAACKKAARRGGDIIVWLDRQDDRKLGQVTNTVGSGRAYAYGGSAYAFGSSTSVSQQFAIDSSMGLVFRYHPEVDAMREALLGLSEERLAAYLEWLEDDLIRRRISEEELWRQVYGFVQDGEGGNASGQRSTTQASRPSAARLSRPPAAPVPLNAGDGPGQMRQRPENAKSPWHSLRPGMNAADVRALIGKPHHTSRGGRSVVWLFGEKSHVVFLDDVLQEWRE